MTSPAAMQVRHLLVFCVFPLVCFVLNDLLFFVQTGLWLEFELELVPLFCSFLIDFNTFSLFRALLRHRSLVVVVCCGKFFCVP